MAYKCECGKEFKTAKGLATHRQFHCRAVSENDDKCKDGCSLELLDAGNSLHAEKMRQGYRKYCTECMELY